MSLANPTNNFYLGGTNELFIRNIQVFYGVGWQKVSKQLSPPTSQPLFGGIGSPPSVVTLQGFQRGAFVGVTYNLTGFIQSLGLGGAKDQ